MTITYKILANLAPFHVPVTMADVVKCLKDDPVRLYEHLSKNSQSEFLPYRDLIARFLNRLTELETDYSGDTDKLSLINTIRKNITDLLENPTPLVEANAVLLDAINTYDKVRNCQVSSLGSLAHIGAKSDVFFCFL